MESTPDLAAQRVAAALGAAGPARWAHLPGRGRGPVQPRPLRLVKVALTRLVKPVVIVGFFFAAAWLCWQIFPDLLGFDGLVPAGESTPVDPNPGPVEPPPPGPSS